MSIVHILLLTRCQLIFSLSKFNVCEITESFGGQFLCVYAKPNGKHEAFSNYQPNSGIVASYVSSFILIGKAKLML